MEIYLQQQKLNFSNTRISAKPDPFTGFNKKNITAVLLIVLSRMTMSAFDVPTSLTVSDCSLQFVTLSRVKLNNIISLYGTQSLLLSALKNTHLRNI